MSSNSDQQIAATMEGLLQLLRPYPYWAIEKACISIRVNGYTKGDGARERTWAPSDADVVHAVKEMTRLYRDQYDSAVAMLNAGVAK